MNVCSNANTEVTLYHTPHIKWNKPTGGDEKEGSLEDLGGMEQKFLSVFDIIFCVEGIFEGERLLFWSSLFYLFIFYESLKGLLDDLGSLIYKNNNF